MERSSHRCRPPTFVVQPSLRLLFKHLCGEHTRASWVHEFWRHVQARRGDANFWLEVWSRIAAIEPQAELALAAAVLLSKLTFGGTAPESLDRWAADRLPRKVRLWVETFGTRVLLADSPGNKLYLILRQELRDGWGVVQPFAVSSFRHTCRRPLRAVCPVNVW